MKTGAPIDKPKLAESNGHRHKVATPPPDGLAIFDDGYPRMPLDQSPAAPNGSAVKPNRRADARIAAVRRGQIVWLPGASVECIIRNLSKTGACLEASGPVPLTFDLILDTAHARRRCHVIWQKQYRLCVDFIRFTHKS